jgi:prepilin-type N-terminal cleavage/methylation domain-containing protein
MNRKDAGFTLVELLVAMVMFVLVIAAASQVFTTLASEFRQQSKIVETQIEGLIGLEILRHDIEHAGYGLPWRMGGATYLEAALPGEGKTTYIDRNFNDGPPTNCTRGIGSGIEPAGASNPPGAIRSANEAEVIAGCNGGGSTFNDSDVLVIKSTSVSRYNNDIGQKWTHLAAGDVKRDDISGYDFELPYLDRVIVIAPGNSETNRRTLVVNDAGSFSTSYVNTAGFAPIDATINLVYGIKPEGDPLVEPRMPFNRADYYIGNPAFHNEISCNAGSGELCRCAFGTGVLYKGELSHADGNIPVQLPLLDCVADMQIVYIRNDGFLVDASYTYDLTAEQIREQIRGVMVYILAQEGQKDANYKFDNYNCPDQPPDTPCILVGPDTGEGREFNLSTYITDMDDPEVYEKYRWKVYTLVVTPENLRVQE